MSLMGTAVTAFFIGVAYVIAMGAYLTHEEKVKPPKACKRGKVKHEED